MKKNLLYLLLGISCLALYVKPAKSVSDLAVENLMSAVPPAVESEYKASLLSRPGVANIPAQTPILPQYARLYEANPDMVGFIYLSDNYRYPVVQRIADQNYYASHDFFGNEEKSGSIFANAHCTLGDRGVTLIYGHCMKSGAMFASLHDWKDEEFFNSHRTIQVDTLYAEQTYEVVATAIINMADDFKYYEFLGFVGEDSFEEWRKGFSPYILRGNLDSLSSDDVIIELSTCSYEREGNRCVLILKLVSDTAS